MGQVELMLRYYNSNVKPLENLQDHTSLGRQGGAM